MVFSSGSLNFSSSFSLSSIDWISFFLSFSFPSADARLSFFWSIVSSAANSSLSSGSSTPLISFKSLTALSISPWIFVISSLVAVILTLAKNSFWPLSSSSLYSLSACLSFEISLPAVSAS